MSEQTRFEHFLLILLLLIATGISAITTFQVLSLARPDLFTNYPFVWPDSFDWITNGLYYLKVFLWELPTPLPTIRQPLFTAVAAASYLLGHSKLLLVVIQVAFLGTILLAYRISNELRFKPIVQLALLSTLTFQHSYNFFKYQIMADVPCLCLSMLAVFYYLRAFNGTELSKNQMTRGAIASAFAGITQFYGLYPGFGFSALLVLWACGKRNISFLRHAVINFVLVVSLQAAWMVFKKIHFGSFTATQVSHFNLLALSSKNTEFYLNVWPIFFGPLLVFTPLAVALYRRGGGTTISFAKASYLAIVVAAFMASVFFYQWQEARFTTYFFPIGAIFGFYLLNSFVSLSPHPLITSATVLGLSYIAFTPTDNAMAPHLSAFLRTMREPTQVAQDNFLALLYAAQPVDHYAGNATCVKDLDLASKVEIRPGCDGYITRNLVRYQQYLQHIAAPE